MDAWNRALGVADAAWQGVVILYGLVLGLGMPGCMLAVAAGLQVARWGLRLAAEDEWEPDAAARMARALGQLLQAFGSAFCAIAMVALVRQLVR